MMNQIANPFFFLCAHRKKSPYKTLNQLQMAAQRAKTNRSSESQSSKCALRIMTKGRWMAELDNIAESAEI